MLWKLAGVFLILSLFLIYLLLPQKQLALTSPVKIAGLLTHQANLPSNNNKSDTFLPSLPTIEKIFGNNHSWIATLSAQRITTMIATGDIIPARSVNYQVLTRHDFKWPYLKAAQVTKNADITFINLESPLIDKCPVTQEGMVFCGDAKNVEGLVYAGVDVASLANNHAGNYNTPGVQQTVNLLAKNNILATGILGPVIKDAKGIKFAFLGYNDVTKPQPGISNVDEEKIKTEITYAKKQADIVIVTCHWGTEYQAQPDDRQKYLAHFLIDAGADLVIGNHPHWIQPIEIYRNKLITYAHGNFVFDQMWSEKTKQGVVGKYTFYDKQLIDVEYLPIQIENYAQPYFLEGIKKQSVLDEMIKESLKLKQ